MSVIRRLAQAQDNENPIAHRQIGEYAPPKPFWELQTWLDWSMFALGVEIGREYGSPMWPDRWSAVLYVGPLYFTATRTWNERP